MLSHKLTYLERQLELVIAGQMMPTKPLLSALLRRAQACREEAQELEARVVPRRQRLQMEHLASGKVTLFPVVAAPEAAS